MQEDWGASRWWVATYAHVRGCEHRENHKLSFREKLQQTEELNLGIDFFNVTHGLPTLAEQAALERAEYQARFFSRTRS